MLQTGDLLQRLDGRAFIKSLYPDSPEPDVAGEVRVKCAFHPDGTASMDFNVLKRAFRCLSCGADGSAVDLWAKYKQVARHKAVEQLAELFGVESSKLVAPAVYEAWHQTLLQSEELKETFLKTKGIDVAMIQEWRLGWDGEAQRITIPICDVKGRCVNVKKYDLFKLHGEKEKYVSISGHGHNRLYPEGAFDGGEEIHVVEGELKMIVHRAHGFNAITETGGAHGWKDGWTEKFRDKRVRIWYDVDGSGRNGSKLLASRLATVAAEVRNCLVPLDPEQFKKAGVEDWYLQGATAADVQAVVDATELFAPDAELQDPALTDPNEYAVELGKASLAWYYHRQLVVPTIVSAKDIAPYVVPKVVGVRCQRGAIDPCAACPVATEEAGNSWHVESDREELLEMLDVTRGRQAERLRSLIGIPQGQGGCRAHELITLESQNVEELRLVPQLGAAGGPGGTPTGGEQTVVKAFYVGHGLETNAPYEVRGRVAADPEDQHSTLILREAKPNVDSLTTFNPTAEELEALKIFQPKAWTFEGLDEKLDDLYDDLEGNVTRIYHRRAMHLLMDLVWHSVLYLPINGEPKKGWLDALVIGDSGCGKSETFMRLLAHYGLGEWIDMKGASVAGLKGGLQENNNRWWVTWGAIPLNDRRMVVLDEVKGCAEEVLQALTSMRSSGLAEVQKIERRRAWARTRLLWVSNPRSDRKVETYNHGILAIKELLGSLEDVRRFDAALVVASNEVTAADIAASERANVGGTLRHPGDLCRRLILWCWSRSLDAVCIEPDAFELALQEATRQGARYSSGIPLVEPSDHRLKLLRLAAALAGRTYSVESKDEARGVEDGQAEGGMVGGRLVVRPCHVEYAAKFLDQLYESRFMGYAEYSKSHAAGETLGDRGGLRKLLLGLPFAKEALLGLSRSGEVRSSDFVDWCELDKDDARKVVSSLVRINALSRHGHVYRKNGAFIEELRLLQRDVENGVVTPGGASNEY